MRRFLRILFRLCLVACAVMLATVMLAWACPGTLQGNIRLCTGDSAKDLSDHSITVRSSGTGITLSLSYQRYEPTYFQNATAQIKRDVAAQVRSGMSGRWYPPADAIFLYPEADGVWFRSGVGSTAVGHRGHQLSLNVPHWTLALSFAIPTALAIVQIWRRRRARRVGLCVKCGYDLRASPERCPECGTVVGDRVTP